MVRTRRNNGKGWHGEKNRHRLARMGVSTVTKDNAQARVQLQKSESFVSTSTNLQTQFDSRDSFGGNAQIISTPKGSKLKSYSTIVAEIKNGKPIVYGKYSQTTMRHIKEYLKQNNFDVESTKQVLKDYAPSKEEQTKDNKRIQNYDMQKGKIIDLAKKAVAGVEHAVEWEKKHLPNQVQWVQDEYHEAKAQVQKIIQEKKVDEFTKDWGVQLWKESGEDVTQFKKDLTKKPTMSADANEVHDEIDHDEDGIPDIKVGELLKQNSKIAKELSSTKEKLSLTKNLAGIPASKIKDYKEKKELLKLPEHMDVSKLSDGSLRELAVKEETSLFFGGNKFEDELLRREERKGEINKRELELKEDLNEKKAELSQKLKERRQEIKEGTSSLFEGIF